MEDYRFTLTPDKITRSNVDLGSLGGPRLAGDKRNNNILNKKFRENENV